MKKEYLFASALMGIMGMNMASAAEAEAMTPEEIEKMAEAKERAERRAMKHREKQYAALPHVREKTKEKSSSLEAMLKNKGRR